MAENIPLHPLSSDDRDQYSGSAQYERYGVTGGDTGEDGAGDGAAMPASGTQSEVRPSLGIVVIALATCVVMMATVGGVIAVCSIPCGPIRNSPPSLVRAAEDGKIQEVQQLIDDGSDVNDRDCEGSTALMKASWHTDGIIVQQLIQVHSINLDLEDKVGQTALIKAVFASSSKVVNLLIQGDANLDIQDQFGESALIHAAWNGNIPIVHALIAANANVNLRDRFGETALFKASYRGWIEVVTSLIQAGAAVNAQDITGETPLHNAAVAGHRAIIEALVHACASVLLKDGVGNTPQDLAMIHGHEEVTALLDPSDPAVSAMSANCTDS